MSTNSGKANNAQAGYSNTKPLTLGEKRFAGVALIFFTLLPAVLIIGYWPDRLPGAKENIKPLYDANLFHTRLVGICDAISYEEAAAMIIDSVSGRKATDSSHANSVSGDAGSVKDSAAAAPAARAKAIVIGDTVVVSTNDGACITVKDASRFIHINTLLLILVALAGFLGNMIHIGTSFTTFLASGKFDRNWILWYYVRPFTASVLALGIYFVFRGGFLNMSGDILNINLYGVMTVSLLAGLFTDRATQKLKEVFDVLFKPKDERPGKLEGDFTVNSITPTEIEAGKENTITIIGEHLGTKKFTAAINDEPVDITKSGETEAIVKYTIPQTQQDKTTFTLVIREETDKEYPFTLTLKQDPNGDAENDGHDT